MMKFLIVSLLLPSIITFTSFKYSVLPLLCLYFPLLSFAVGVVIMQQQQQATVSTSNLKIICYVTGLFE